MIYTGQDEDGMSINVNAVDSDGHTALAYASVADQPEIVRALGWRRAACARVAPGASISTNTSRSTNRVLRHLCIGNRILVDGSTPRTDHAVPPAHWRGCVGVSGPDAGPPRVRGPWFYGCTCIFFPTCPYLGKDVEE
jgi:hypothetical protein